MDIDVLQGIVDPFHYIIDGIFPLALALAALTDTRRKDALATFLSLAGLVAYLAMYVNGYPVY